MTFNNNNQDKRTVVNINIALTGEEESLLDKLFPEFKINFTHGEVVSHAYAKASRTLERELCFKKLDVRNFDVISSRGETVCDAVNDPETNTNVLIPRAVITDIGGNWAQHAGRLRTNVHCCCPIIDGEDVSRFENRCTTIENMRNRTRKDECKRHYDLVMRNEGERFFCFNKAENCPKKSLYGMMVHVYDIPIETLVDTMVDKGMRRIVGCMIFTPEILMYNEGLIYAEGAHTAFNESHASVNYTTMTTGLNCRYHKGKDKYGEDKIFFTFTGDRCHGYSHNADSYRKFFTTPTPIGRKHRDRMANMELKESRGGIQFFELTLLSDYFQLDCTQFVSLALPSLESKVVLTGWIMSAKGSSNSLRRVIRVVPAKLYESVMGYCLRFEKETFSITDILHYAISVNNRYIVNGMHVRDPNSVPVLELQEMASMMYLISYIKRFDVGCAVKKIIEDIKYVRNFSKHWYITRIFKKVMRKEIFTNHDNSYKSIAQQLSSEGSPRHNALVEMFKKWGEISYKYPVGYEYVTAIDMYNYIKYSKNDPTMVNGFEVNINLDEPDIDEKPLTDETQIPVHIPESQAGKIPLPDAIYLDNPIDVNKTMTRVNVPGDGYCVYNSLWRAYSSLRKVDKQLNGEELRSVLRDHASTYDVSRSYFEKISHVNNSGNLSNDYWGDDEDMRLFSAVYKVKVICSVYDAITSKIYETRVFGDADDTIYLAMHISEDGKTGHCYYYVKVKAGVQRVVEKIHVPSYVRTDPKVISEDRITFCNTSTVVGFGKKQFKTVDKHVRRYIEHKDITIDSDRALKFTLSEEAKKDIKNTVESIKETTIEGSKFTLKALKKCVKSKNKIKRVKSQIRKSLNIAKKSINEETKLTSEEEIRDECVKTSQPPVQSLRDFKISAKKEHSIIQESQFKNLENESTLNSSEKVNDYFKNNKNFLNQYTRKPSISSTTSKTTTIQSTSTEAAYYDHEQYLTILNEFNTIKAEISTDLTPEQVRVYLDEMKDTTIQLLLTAPKNNTIAYDRYSCMLSVVSHITKILIEKEKNNKNVLSSNSTLNSTSDISSLIDIASDVKVILDDIIDNLPVESVPTALFTSELIELPKMHEPVYSSLEGTLEVTHPVVTSAENGKNITINEEPSVLTYNATSDLDSISEYTDTDTSLYINVKYAHGKNNIYFYSTDVRNPYHNIANTLYSEHYHEYDVVYVDRLFTVARSKKTRNIFYLYLSGEAEVNANTDIVSYTMCVEEAFNAYFDNEFKCSDIRPCVFHYLDVFFCEDGFDLDTEKVTYYDGRMQRYLDYTREIAEDYSSYQLSSLFVYDTFDSLVNGFVRIGEIHNTDYTTLEVFSELLLDYDDYTCKIDTLLEKAKTLISLLEKPHLAEITRADVVYRTGDLLEANEPVIAHCISADAKMSKGIALKIKEKYPTRRNIFQNATVRDVIIQRAQDESSYTFSRIIYHLVTKECYFHKPTQNDFRFALKKLLDACIAKGISHLAVPRLGSGLDKLPWSFVEEQLLLFVDSGIKVIVYELPSVDTIKTENNKDENDDALSETSTNSTISNSLTQTNLTSQQIEHCADAAMEQIQHWIDATGITKRKLIKYLESFEEFGTKCPYYSAKKAGVKNPEGIHVYNIKQDKILTITKEIRRQDFIINYSHVFYQEKRGNLRTFHIIRTPIRYETDPETKRKVPFLDTEVFENVSNIYVCNETKIFNDFEFSNLYQGATKASILKDLITLQPNISLTEGVPGCGKTTYILKSHDYKKDMILTTTREGTNDIRNRALEILRERGVVTEQQLPNGHSLSVINQDDGVSIPWSVFSEKRYKTLDSMLMRKPTCNVEKLLIDEALMQHPGRVVLAVIAAKAKLVELLGDRGQIGYINRARQSICKFSDYSFIPVEKVLYVSYRCPLDVAVIFSKCYARNIQLIPKHDKPFMSTKELLNTMELKQISHESEIPNVNGNVKYLTFTQPDKMMLTAHLKKVHKDYTNGVNTVHEYQGSQSETVVLVRLNEVASTSLFLDIRYVLVALTRHKSKLIYCMKRTVNTDLVMQKIEESKKITKISAKNFLKLTKAGAYDPVVQEASVDVNMSYISQPRAVDPATLELLPSIIIDAETNFFQPMAYETTDKHLRFKRIFDISTSDSHSFNMIKEPSRIVLQDFVDTLLPGTSVEDQTFDAHMVHFSDLEVNVENVIIDADKIVPAIRRRNERNILTNVDSFLKPTDGLDPVLRTPMPLNRGQTHYETMLGMIKRNMNVPQMAGIVDDDYLVQQMVKRYILSYVSVDGLANISYFMRENVNVNTEALRNWVVKNGISPKLIGINNDKYSNVGYREKNMSTFNYMLKSQVKPKLNVDCTREYASVQTIAYHDKSITSIYSPVFRDMSFRKKKILKKNAIIFNEMSNDDFQEILNTSFPNPQVLNNRTSLQCDISKYDKSQGIVALRFNYYIYLALGMPKDMADTWYLTHLDTELRAKDVGLSANVKYQRKSGDSDTFGGNTDFTMGVMSYIFKMYSTTHEKEIDKLLEHNSSENWLSEFLYSLSSLNDHHPYLIKTTYDIATFAGDDSWIIGDMLYSEDMSSAASLLFNLETKFCLYKCHYFCSRILVPLTDHWVVVPDLLKLLVKLGRKDIKNSAHLEEYRISLCDLVKGYLDPTICEYISMYIKEIYKINTCSVNVINNLISFIYNPASFSKLWKATHEEKFFEINPAGALIIFEDSSEVSRATLAKNVEKFSPEYLSKKPLVILTNNLHTFDKYVTITNFNMCLEPTKASLDKFIKYKIPTVYFSPDIDFLKHLNKMDDVRVLQHYSNVPINFKFKHQENFNNIPFETVLNKSKYIKHSRLAIGQAISLSSYKKIMSSKKSLMSLSYYTSVFFVGKNPDSCDIYQTEFANETHIVRLVRTRASNLKYISSARKDLTDE